MKIMMIVLLLLGLSACPRIAYAQTCTVTMSDVDFGSVDPLSSTQIDISGTVKATCSGFATSNAQVCFGLGLGSGGGTYAQRRMSGPSSNTLLFTFYQDPARTILWGDSQGTDHELLPVNLALSGGAGIAMGIFYGRIFVGQSSAATGSYTTRFGSPYVYWVGYASSPPIQCSGATAYTSYAFNASATVISNCNISASNIDFGQTGFIGSAINATGVITSTCSNNTPYTLALSAGQGTGATMTARRMNGSAGGTLQYRLYRDAARTQAWGDGGGGTVTASGTGNTNAQTHTVYATLPAQGSAPPGNYSDTVTVTVTF